MWQRPEKGCPEAHFITSPSHQQTCGNVTEAYQQVFYVQVGWRITRMGPRQKIQREKKNTCLCLSPSSFPLSPSLRLFFSFCLPAFSSLLLIFSSPSSHLLHSPPALSPPSCLKAESWLSFISSVFFEMLAVAAQAQRGARWRAHDAKACSARRARRAAICAARAVLRRAPRGRRSAARAAAECHTPCAPMRAAWLLMRHAKMRHMLRSAARARCYMRSLRRVRHAMLMECPPTASWHVPEYGCLIKAFIRSTMNPSRP